MLLKICGGKGLTKIINNDYRIYIEKVYFKNFPVLTRVNVEGEADKNKRWAT